jgi:hypothetical protein
MQAGGGCRRIPHNPSEASGAMFAFGERSAFIGTNQYIDGHVAGQIKKGDNDEYE